MAYKILIVEDDADISEILEYNLKIADYNVITAKNGISALQKLTEFPDLIILDVMMPEMDGYEVCKKIRQNKDFNAIPIIFLTGKSQEIDELKGLSVGGDDYLTKPFSMTKVLARIKSHLRTATKAEDTILKFISEFGTLTIDREKFEVLLDDEIIYLPKKEFELLYFFSNRPNRVYSRSEIINSVWGDDVFVIDRTVDVHVQRIREKLGKAGKIIVTLKGVGYKFVI